MRPSLEVTSERKKNSLIKLVEIGFYPAPYALLKAEDYHDKGQLLDTHYEELAEYLESLLEPVEETETDVETIEQSATNEENVASVETEEN